jgi:hypothetical protein
MNMRGSGRRQPYTLQDMMSDDRARNSWVKSGLLDFYVRKGRIWTRQDDASYIKPCLMVANFNIRRPHPARLEQYARQMVTFMKEVEATAVRCGYAGVFVECVYNTRLHQPLQQSGYRRWRPASDAAPCFFKPTATIRTKAHRRARFIQELPKPSLRRFLQTPDIGQHWIREQNDNVTLLVRRDRIGAFPSERLRFTLIDLYHYKIETRAADTHADHGFYWCRDEASFLRLLGKLETRLATAGFHELAVHTDAVDISIKTDYGSTNEGADPAAAHRRMRELGYDIASDTNGAKVYLKSLAPPSA